MESSEKSSHQLRRNPIKGEALEVRLGFKERSDYFCAVPLRHRKAWRMAKHLIRNETRLTSDSHRNNGMRIADEPTTEGRPGSRLPRWLRQWHRSVSTQMGLGEASGHARLTGLMSAGKSRDLFQLCRGVAPC
jgi:hypothetical protein